MRTVSPATAYGMGATGLDWAGRSRVARRGGPGPR